MNVVRLHAAGDLRIHKEEVPQPGPDEVLLRVSAVGICASDLHWFSEGGIGDARLSRPLVLGHEFSAVVEAIGANVTGFVPGQRVVVDPNIPCHHCEFCLAGHPNLCPNCRFAGHGVVDGALREQMVWPAECLFALPDTLSDAEGAALEPMGVALHAVNLSHLKPGMSVGVFGCGPIGLMILQIARAAGATQIIATDPLPHRLKLALELGGSQVFKAEAGQEQSAVLAATGQRGVDLAFEVAGQAPAVDTAVAAACPGGKVLLVGIPEDDQTTFSASTARRKGLTLKLVRRMKHTYPRAIQLVESGLVQLKPILSHEFTLTDSSQAFVLANQRVGHKITINPQSQGD